MKAWPQLTLAGGPVQVTERTLRAQSRPVLYHYDPAFIELYERTCGLPGQSPRGGTGNGFNRGGSNRSGG